MFPLGRKQALLGPEDAGASSRYLKELQEKYKDDKEQQTKETFALYKRHGVNPVGGCLPALIQLPIFVGLWQALNTSFPLRHATFLWIRDLAAPDMLFHFPFESTYSVPGPVVQRAAVPGRRADAGPDQALRAAGHDARGRACSRR